MTDKGGHTRGHTFVPLCKANPFAMHLHRLFATGPPLLLPNRGLLSSCALQQPTMLMLRVLLVAFALCAPAASLSVRGGGGLDAAAADGLEAAAAAAAAAAPATGGTPTTQQGADDTNTATGGTPKTQQGADDMNTATGGTPKTQQGADDTNTATGGTIAKSSSGEGMLAEEDTFTTSKKLRGGAAEDGDRGPAGREEEVTDDLAGGEPDNSGNPDKSPITRYSPKTFRKLPGSVTASKSSS